MDKRKGIGAAIAGAILTASVAGATTVDDGGVPPHFWAPNQAAWSAKCVRSMPATAVDPIVSPGVEPSAHQHSILGEPITSTTTPADLRAMATNFCPVSVTDPGDPTKQLADNSAYWVPTLCKSTVKPCPTTDIVPVGYGLFYYRSAGKDPATVLPPPQDLAMVAGDSHAMEPQPAHVGWLCIAGVDRTVPTPTIPASCPVTGATSGLPYMLKAFVIFPDCFNGDLTPTSNWSSRMVYAGDNPDTGSHWSKVCPAGYTPIPSIQQEIRWPLAGRFPSDGQTYDLSGATLASDSMDMGGMNTGPHGTTLHSDYLSGWTTDELLILVEACYHVDSHNCGAFGFGPHPPS